MKKATIIISIGSFLLFGLFVFLVLCYLLSVTILRDFTLYHLAGLFSMFMAIICPQKSITACVFSLKIKNKPLFILNIICLVCYVVYTVIGTATTFFTWQVILRPIFRIKSKIYLVRKKMVLRSSYKWSYGGFFA